MPAPNASAAQVVSFRPIPIECYTSASPSDRKRSPAGLTMRIEPPTTTEAATESLVAAQPAGVTAIVPARDEEQVIAACVRGAGAAAGNRAKFWWLTTSRQTKPRRSFAGLTAEIPQLRLLETRDVPPGWVGKNNAVWLGVPKGQERVAACSRTPTPSWRRERCRARCKSRAKRVPRWSRFHRNNWRETWYEKIADSVRLLPAGEAVFLRGGERPGFARSGRQWTVPDDPP